jgi:ATP dependent DNA ligase domain
VKPDDAYRWSPMQPDAVVMDGVRHKIKHAPPLSTAFTAGWWGLHPPFPALFNDNGAREGSDVGPARLIGSNPLKGEGGFYLLGAGSRFNKSTRIPPGPAPYPPAMLWRVSPSRSRRLPPPGFVQPARPLLTTKPRSGAEWIHEVKHDGYRLLALKDAGRVVLWSRYATDYSDTFLSIAEAVRALPVDGVLLDGEAIVSSGPMAIATSPR